MKNMISKSKNITQLESQLIGSIDELKKALEHAQDIMETIREPFLVLDTKLRVITANPAFYNTFKVLKKDTEGTLVYQLGNRQWDIPELRKLLEKILPKHTYFKDFEAIHIFPAIGSKTMLLNARKIHHKNLILLAIEDITQRKELETQKDDFIAVASHELKTPVTSIKAYTQILKRRFEKRGDATAVQNLMKMDAQINKLTDIIGKLLDITKIESGKLVFKKEFFDFDSLTEEIVKEIQLTATNHKITVKGKTKRRVFADRMRIGLVLVNFLTNAIRYSPRAAKVIVHLSAGKKTVTVGVQDFGIGIEKTKQAKIFQRFFRAARPEKEVHPSLGLGLYIASEIIEWHNGKMWLKSKVGKGSTFYFRIQSE